MSSLPSSATATATVPMPHHHHHQYHHHHHQQQGGLSSAALASMPQPPPGIKVARSRGGGSGSSSGGGGTKDDSFSLPLLFWMGSWYFCSLITLFMNKIILSSEGGNKYVLGITQMIMTAVLGAAKVYGPSAIAHVLGTRTSPKPNEITSAVRPYNTFWRDMIFVGVMRGLTVLFGLISLANVAVSFTETIKSSAPFFTVIFAQVILRQRTSWQVNVSLLPVMLGLALCSATELSFNTIGFLAAVANNVIDCIQNVFSKHLLKSMTPVQLQFYTSAAAAILQLPVLLYTLAPELKSASIPGNIWIMILIDAVFYHLQSVTAYFTMSLLTPVSQSVANTVKRALLIFLSILWFGNEISFLSGAGMVTVVFGVFLYNHCRLNYPAPQDSNSSSKTELPK
ncbi:solute carrier family 35 member E2 [Salpingoeca rosetta]|uniref:Solute carrier family 35 member E2 n=1 Tax=Salpingoeca rosetta (strain ATCC 50818 / BSB-021) TaxID=946362 RepID=F2U120_SALR5|nr:solute carrier family 35 member E2 [Salpingoeca rosetta]EGD80594.1 solute carrier family 35 member E2 [Salpingoeca rosetta]|eukprot:XP_004997155.1 solute carrier family 35 member E2 [Salpingoeca rosetta]